MNDTKSVDQLRFWQSRLLDDLPWLIHGVTERSGGTSVPPYHSLNLGLHVGDDGERVLENRKRVAAAAGLTLDRMVCAEQVHGSRAALATAEDTGRGAAVVADAIPGVDALVSAEKELLLTLFFADCLPILLADKRQRIIAVAHAGWRGLVAGVIEHALDLMTRKFGSHPESIIAVLGPGIGPCCFEVGPEVAQSFPASVLTRQTKVKAHVDLPMAARLHLLAAGVPPSQIESADICTACHTERFFSHRREQGRTGRMAAFIGVRGTEEMPLQMPGQSLRVQE